jgi:broad-specificity NMP kinase
LLVRNSAVAAKLRQLTPALLERLQARGWPVERIRIKVLGSL